MKSMNLRQDMKSGDFKRIPSSPNPFSLLGRRGAGAQNELILCSQEVWGDSSGLS